MAIVACRTTHSRRECGRSGTSASPTASVAEANDVANLILDGVSGLVLTGETAVGTDPLAAVERIARLLDGTEPRIGRSKSAA